jgi:hypothetical protein
MCPAAAGPAAARPTAAALPDLALVATRIGWISPDAAVDRGVEDQSRDSSHRRHALVDDGHLGADARHNQNAASPCSDI